MTTAVHVFITFISAPLIIGRTKIEVALFREPSRLPTAIQAADKDGSAERFVRFTTAKVVASQRIVSCFSRRKEILPEKLYCTGVPGSDEKGMKTNPGAAGRESGATQREVDAALEQYSNFVERRLKPDLDSACERRDKYFQELAKLDQVSKALDMLDASATESEKDTENSPIETRVNIGEEFYIRAVVDDVDKVVLDIGLGVLVEVSRAEARKLLAERKQFFTALSDTATDRITHVQAHMKSVMTSLSKLRLVRNEAALTGEIEE